MIDEIENNEVTQVEQKTDVQEEIDPQELIKKVNSSDDLQDFLSLFNLSIAKKQALRVAKREEILDIVTDSIKERITKRPDEMTTKDLLDCDKVMSEQKQKELGIINQVKDQPAITLNQQNNNVTVNIDGPTLDRDSKDKVIDAVKELLKLAKEQPVETIDTTANDANKAE